MTFESLWPLAFLLAVPIIIIFYLLIPKGKDTKISSNLLWNKLFVNRQSKTFLEKFLHNILMYLQIVIALLLVLALMTPYINRKGNANANVIMVLDTSGSMQHVDESGKTRLDLAKDAIRQEIADSPGSTFSIVTAHANETELLAVGVTDSRQLSQVLDGVKASDSDGSLSSVEDTVDALSSQQEENKKTSVLVYTDGIGAADTDALVQRFDASVCVMGDAGENVSNDFLSCVKDENGYQAAAGVTNYSDKEATLEVSLYEGDATIAVRSVTVPAKESYTALFENLDWDGKPLKSEISAIRFAGSEAKDSLLADNVTYAIASQAAKYDAVLIGKGNTYIAKAYEAVSGESLVQAKSESTLEADDTRARIYDAGTADQQKEALSRIVFADATDATGREEHVALTVSDTEITSGIKDFTIGVNETYTYEVPEWATGFLWAGKKCAGYYGEHDGLRVVVVGFDLRESDFPLQAEFPVFMANALSFLNDSSLLAQNVYTAGEKIVYHPQSDVDVSTLETNTDKAGLYEVTAGDKTESYVVRFATGTQSDGSVIAKSTGDGVTAQSGMTRKSVRSLVIVLILLLLILEWIVYVKQMRYRGKFYLGVRLVGLALLVLAAIGITVPKRADVNTTIFLVDASTSNESNLSDMDSYIGDAIKQMPGGNQYGIVTFGKKPMVEQFVTKEKHFAGILSTPDRTATNLEEAISRGLSMIPEGSAGRLVILTDGRQTRGNIDNTASAVLTRGVELLSVVYDMAQGKDAYIDNVEMPSYLYAGDAYSMTVSVMSNYETDADLEIWMGNAKKSTTSVHLNKGSNSFVLKQKVSGENIESFSVKVNAKGDTCEENNTFNAYSVIDSLPKVLVVCGANEDSTNFAALLDSAGCNYKVVPSAGAPTTLEGLLKYKSVILENVHMDDLPEEFVNLLDTYVKDYGCGLVAAGGEESFGLGLYRNTVLEDILPVDMMPRSTNEVPSLAMVMVIDHSGSMSGEGDSDSGATNLDLAITAANHAVDELTENDYVGVVTFDDRYDWQLPITKVDDKDAIHKRIETIPDGGGTTIKPALNAALSEIVKCDADIKHVVLLTDGQGEDRNFAGIINDYKEKGVTLSTVAVGEYSDKSLLEQVARGCGGRYYYCDNGTDMPKIFAQEVLLSGETYIQNGTFSLAVNSSNAITRGLFADGIPKIKGYISVTPKSAANVLFASDKDDPILSVMQYGLGHTVAWNTDVTNKWTAGFAGNDDYVQLWKRIIDYSSGNAALGEDSLDVQTSGEVTTLHYKAQDYGERTTVEAVYTDPDGETHSVKLPARAPGEYEAKIDTDIPGIYNLSVRRSDDGELKNAITTAAVAQYSDEYKFAADNESFLSFVNRYGKVIKPGDSFWKKLKTTSRAAYDLSKWLLIVAILWFLLDVAMRRFAFVPQDSRLYRWIKSRWTKHKNKAIITSDKKKSAQGVVDAKTTGADASGENASDIATATTQHESESRKASAKAKRTSKKKKKQEEAVLDTSALLKKKDLRDQ
mgnify:CR=1 FL=1